VKITILVYGSLGDVQPYVALGAGLARAGHDVRVAADPFYESLILRQGLSFVPVSGNPTEVLESEAGQTFMDGQASILKRMSAYGAFNREMADHIAKNLEESWTACRDAEAFIFSFLAYGGYHIAEKLGVPSFAVAISPFTRTRAMPSITFAPREWLGDRYNLLTHTLTERMFFMPPSSKKINQWREQTLGLKPLPRKGHMESFRSSRNIPVLYSFSPVLMPRPADWPDWVHAEGYWFAETDAIWQPPQGLVEFLAAGPAPVYIGFGSMSAKAGGRSVADSLEMLFQALERAGQRGIISVGADVTQNIAFPSTVYRCGDVPHEWLFPQMAMTVHHGGSGTTAQSLRAGVPMLITPFMWDQPFWGRQVETLGFGPKPIPHKKLTADNLAKAISETVNDPKMREAARFAGERVRSEQGIARVVDVIHERLRASNRAA